MTWPLNEAALKHHIANPVRDDKFFVEMEKYRSDSEFGAIVLEFNGSEGLGVKLHLRGEVAVRFPKQRLDLACIFIGKALPLMKNSTGKLMISMSDSVYFNFEVPTLVFSRHKQCPLNILFPDTDFIGSGGYETEKLEITNVLEQQPWSSRKQILFWRGTDSSPKSKLDPKVCERTILCRTVRTFINSSLYDCALVDVTQVDQLETLKNEGLLALPVKFKDFLQYRYLLDIDGWSNSWSGCFRKLLSGSLLFKVESDWEQWYYDKIRPWEHYVPVKKDISDLEEKVSWAIENDSEARAISENARQTAMGITFQQTIEETAETLSLLLNPASFRL